MKTDLPACPDCSGIEYHKSSCPSLRQMAYRDPCCNSAEQLATANAEVVTWQALYHDLLEKTQDDLDDRDTLIDALVKALVEYENAEKMYCSYSDAHIKRTIAFAVLAKFREGGG